MASESLRGRVATATPGMPLDLVVVLVSLGVADAVLLGLSEPSLLARAAVGVPLLFLLPGYAVVSALFPRGRHADTPVQSVDGIHRPVPGGRPPSTAERLALAFGLSVAALPLVGVLLGQTTGYGLASLVTALSVVVVAGVAVAALRRLRLPATERYRTTLGTWLTTGWRSITDAESTGLAAARLLVAVLVVASVAGLGYAVVAAESGAGYTDLLLVTEDDDGEYVASDFPESLETGEPTPLTARVANHEGAATDYTVVVQLQTVDRDNGTVTATDRAEVTRASESVADGDVWLYDHEVAATEPREDSRLTYLLYRGDAPEDPTVSSAYRHTHLWVDVVDGGG